MSYDRLGELLAPSALSPSPAEAHGILCGLICGGSPDPRGAWLEQLLPGDEGAESQDLPQDLLAAQTRPVLDDLAVHTIEEIGGPGLGFSLLLPEESRPLAERATALYDWVRGFLYALGLLGVRDQDLSEQTREVFRDFADLTRLDLDDLADDEDNEAALSEIIEFVWVAAMLVYEERVTAPHETAQASKNRCP